MLFFIKLKLLFLVQMTIRFSLHYARGCEAATMAALAFYSRYNYQMPPDTLLLIQHLHISRSGCKLSTEHRAYDKKINDALHLASTHRESKTVLRDKPVADQALLRWVTGEVKRLERLDALEKRATPPQIDVQREFERSVLNEVWWVQD